MIEIVDECEICHRSNIKTKLYRFHRSDREMLLCKVDRRLAARFYREIGIAELDPQPVTPEMIIQRMRDWRNYHPIREQVERTSKYDKNPVLQIGK